jgi:hypothetical protein
MVTRQLDDVLCLAAAALLASVLWFTSLVRTEDGRADLAVSPSRSAVGYVVGDSVSPLPTLNFEDANQTLLIVLKSDCPYCTASAHFYSRLLATAAKPKRRVRVVVAGSVADERLESYLIEQNLPVEALHKIPRGALKIRGTPTLLLVSSTGRVDGIWVGQLSSKVESELIGIIGAS